jgi:hypothetical protein
LTPQTVAVRVPAPSAAPAEAVLKGGD